MIHYMGIKCAEYHVSVVYYQVYFCFHQLLPGKAIVQHGKYFGREVSDRSFSVTMQNLSKFSSK